MPPAGAVIEHRLQHPARVAVVLGCAVLALFVGRTGVRYQCGEAIKGPLQPKVPGRFVAPRRAVRLACG